MAVNLTKPSVLREYTPVHLCDEEDTIPKVRPSITPEQIAQEPAAPEVQEIFPSVKVASVQNVPIVQGKPDLQMCMDELMQGISTADEATQQRFVTEFMQQAKQECKQIQIARRKTSTTYQLLHLAGSDIIPGVLCSVLSLVSQSFFGDFVERATALGDTAAAARLELLSGAATIVLTLLAMFFLGCTIWRTLKLVFPAVTEIVEKK